MMRSLFPPSSEAALLAALKLLDRLDPSFAARLRLPVSTVSIVIKDGVPHRLLGRGSLPLTMAPSEIQAALSALPSEGPLLIFGIGTGELLVEALKKYPERQIAAWTRDPLEWRLVLSRHNLQKALSSRRLTPVLGVDILRLPPNMALVEQTGAFRCWPEEAAFYRHPPPNPKNAPRVMLLSGELYVEDTASSLRDLGFVVFPRDPMVQSLEEMDHSFQSLQPRLVVAINQRDGLVEWCGRHQVPLLIWEIDPSLRPPSPVSCTSPVHFHTYRRANQAPLRAAGYPHVRYTPLAADLDRCPPSPLSDEERPLFASEVAFVGSSMLGSAPHWRRQFLEHLRRYNKGISEENGLKILEELLGIQRAHPRRWLLPSLLSQALPGFLELCQPEDASLWLGELASAERRLIMIHTLASSFPVDVWGDSGWQRAPAARYRGPATHRVQAAKVYAGATINLDIGRLYQMDIMTMRVPDVLASGGFLIAERSETLAELFREGEHLEAWASVEELHQKVSYYLKNPQKAREIALQGQAHVRAHHSIRARLEQMLFDIPLKKTES